MAASSAARPAAQPSRDRGSGGSLGSSELPLGLHLIVGVLDNRTSGIRPDLWATSCAGAASSQRHRGAKQPPGTISFAGTDFFTVGGADLARTGDVLCAIFHSPGKPTGSMGGIPDHLEACRCATWLATRHWRDGASEGCRYLLHVRDAKFCAELRASVAAGDLNVCDFLHRAQLERCCGALGAIGERGMLIPSDPVRRTFAKERDHTIPRALRRSTKARTTFWSSAPLLGLSPVGDVAPAVENASAVYSGSRAA
jgi:hypothetical protein